MMMRVFTALAFTILLWPYASMYASNTGDPNEGITINGVTWARFNVAEPGTFTTSETDYGNYYQWNCNTGWCFSQKRTVGLQKGEKIVTGGGDSSCSLWVVANDPCPSGWRIPNRAELESLKQHTGFSAQVRNYNGVGVLGYMFRKGDQTLFLPASGYKKDGGLPVDIDMTGHYWSSTGDDAGTSAAFLLLNYYVYEKEWGDRTVARTIRCVKE